MRFRLIPIGLVFFLCLVASSSSWARAGGGEGFSDGGGGGYSGGDGGGVHFQADPFEGHGRPYSNRGGSIPLPVAIGGILFIVLFLWLFSKYGHRLRMGSRQFGLPPLPLSKGNAQIDSGWSRQASQWVAEAGSTPIPEEEWLRIQKSLHSLFEAIQNAWSKNQLELVHRHLSDGVFSRWQIQLDMHRREGRKNLLLQQHLVRSQAIGFRQQGGYESIDVLIRASLIDLDLQVSDPVPSLLPPPQVFEELWSFTRLNKDVRGQEKMPSDGLQSSGYGSQCSNCGGDTSQTSGVKCSQCGAILNSGAYDWVLAEITQVNSRQPFGLGGRQEKDAHPSRHHIKLSIQEMEDRASTVFVRLIEAVLDGKPGLMRPYASDACVESLRQSSGPFQEMSLERLSVGAVEWIGTETMNGFTRASMRVLYSTSRNTMIPTPKKHSLLMVFEKRVQGGELEVAASTSGDKISAGMNSLNCPQCGAPVGHSEQARCEYCSETLNDPQHHWVLVDLKT